MKLLFILLLYNSFPKVTYAQEEQFFRCNTTCISHSSILVPIFSTSTSELDINLLKLNLLSQVDTCFRKEFSVEVYLTGSKEWFRCCDARSCIRGILNLTKENFILPNVKGEIDSKGVSKILKIIDQLLQENKGQIYVLSDFIIRTLWTTENGIKIALVSDEIADDVQKIKNSRNVQVASSIAELNKLNKPYCSRRSSRINSQCISEMSENTNNVVELRIFLGFSSRGHFFQIVEGLAKFLSEDFFDDQQGKIIILGPRAKVIGRCWWYNPHKCILDLQAKGEDAIHVNADVVTRDDVEFSPDVMGFMRREAIQQKQIEPTFVLVISDFISINFLDNKYIFQKAMATKRVALVLGVILSWNGLDKQTAKKHYDNNRAQPHTPSTNEYVNTVSLTYTDHTSEHCSDAVIVLALAYWTDEMQLSLLKSYLTKKALTCVNEQNQFAIHKNENTKLTFCLDAYCLQEEINSIDISNSLSEVDNTYELVEEALETLDPFYAPSDQMPSIILVTNYISKVFMKFYDDSKSDFRRNLSFVDFQVLLVNSSNDYHEYSSLSNRIIHVFPTFDQLEQAENYFCKPGAVEYSPQKEGILGTGEIILICVAVIAFLIVLVVIACCIRKYQNDDTIQLNDRTPIISKDLDDLGKEILNISGLARTREDPWQMSRQQIIQGTELGRGSGGVVYRGSILGRAPCEFIYRRNFYAYQYDNCPVAIKEQLIGSDEKGRQQLLDEIEIMKAIRPHQNIANMLGCVTNVNPVCLVLEFAEGGSMKQFIKGKPILPVHASIYALHNVLENNKFYGAEPYSEHKNFVCQRDVLSFLWQICNGLTFVHHCGVIHRDVAARNILLKRGRNVLLADFGLAVWKESKVTFTKIKRLPIKWTAPESLSKAQFSEASDVWSFGVCAWEILTSGEDPFNHVPTPEILSYLNSGRRLDRPQTCSEQLWKVLTSCWNDDPSKRPKFYELKSKLSPLLEDVCSGYGYVVPLPE